MNFFRFLKFFLIVIVPVGILVTFATTGYKYVPVELTLGKCMKDYTSPLSYKERISPMRSHRFYADGAEILVCYGSPGKRGRTIFGDVVPLNSLWRMGANEPTRLYTSSDIVLGEVVVPKGRYSLYAIPGSDSWEIFISTSTTHWGNDISRKVRVQEIGSFEVQKEYNRNVVEYLTIRSEDNELIIMWDRARVRIPIENIDS